MSHSERQRQRGDATPRKAPDAGASPWPKSPDYGALPADQGLGLETPPGYERPGAAAPGAPEAPELPERAPLALEGFNPQHILIAGAIVGWIMAGRGGKGQGVRLIDVFLLGPLMAQAGLWESRDQPWAQALMRAAAGATVTYNLRNYLANE